MSDEIIIFGNKIGLAIDLDDGTRLGIIGNINTDDPFGCDPGGRGP